jgi:hypothetical protein
MRETASTGEVCGWCRYGLQIVFAIEPRQKERATEVSLAANLLLRTQ